MTDKEIALQIGDQIIAQRLKIAAFKQVLMEFGDRLGADWSAAYEAAYHQLSCEELKRLQFGQLQALLDEDSSTHPLSALQKYFR